MRATGRNRNSIGRYRAASRDWREAEEEARLKGVEKKNNNWESGVGGAVLGSGITAARTVQVLTNKLSDCVEYSKYIGLPRSKEWPIKLAAVRNREGALDTINHIIAGSR